MKKLNEFIEEASANAKKRNISFAKKLYIRGKEIGGIGSFGIMTAENPNSQQLSRSENRKLNDDLKKQLKLWKYVYVPIDGHFGGNVEHSFIIFNIRLDVLSALAGQYEQTSFFYCYPTNDGIMSEYWEKSNTNKNYDKSFNPYVFINSTTIWHNEHDAEDNFSIIGGDFKYTIDPEVFVKINEQICNNLNKAADQTGTSVSDILEIATNTTGQKSMYYRELIYEKIVL